MSQDTVALLRERLSTLAPLSIDIIDESHLHAGHAGARDGGGHYRLHIVAEAFTGKNTLARHRLVYAAAGDLMRVKIHALIIEARTPAEV